MLITFLDLFATLATFKFCDLQYNDDLTYEQALLGGLTVTSTLPDVLAGTQNNDTVTVNVANGITTLSEGSGYGTLLSGADSGYGDDWIGYGGRGPATISEIQRVEDLHGKGALVRVYDTVTAAYVLSVYGTITNLSAGVGSASLTIESRDTEALEEVLPKVKLLTVYPNVDLANIRSPDAIIVVAFGVMRKVPLQLVQTGTSRYDFGAFRKPSSGSLTLNTVYRDGAVVPSAEYSFVESPTGYYVVRFTAPQTNFSNQVSIIQADVTSTEFTNPATAISFLLSDSTYGLGRSVNAASFTSGASDYTSLSIAISGGLMQQYRAQDLLDLLLLHGAVLKKNTSGEYTLTVDTSSLHTTASTNLGAADGFYNNLDITKLTEAPPSLDNRRRSLTLRGLLDPGFDGSGAYLISSVRPTGTITLKGKDETIDHPFLGDTTSLDRQLHYLWYRSLSGTKAQQVTAPFDLSVLGLRQLLSLYVPALAINGDQYEVRQIDYERNTQENGDVEQWLTFLLGGYDATIFSYSAGSPQSAPSASYLTDYSQTIPTAPSSCTVTPNTASKDATGKVTATFTVSAVAPSSNVTHIVIQLFENGAILPTQQLEIAVAASATATGKFYVNPAQSYDTQFFTRNKGNKAGYQDSSPVNVTGTTASNTPGAPATPSTPVATQGTGKIIVVDWADNSETDMRFYDLQRSVNGGAYSTLKSNLRDSTYTDKGLTYGNTYAYKVIAKNKSGQSSSASSASNTVTLAKITGSSDVGAGTITGGSGGNIGTNEVDGTNIPDDTITSNKRTTLSSASFSHSHSAATHNHSVTISAFGTPTNTSSDGINQNTAITTITHSKGRQVLAVIDTGNSAVAGHYRNNGTTSFDVCTVNVTNSSPTISGTVYYW